MKRHSGISAAILGIFMLFLAHPAKADILDDLNALFRTGNTAEISKYFGATVEISVSDQRGNYSKAQATAVLADFFKKHPPSSSKIVHKLTSNPAHLFAVVELTTSNGEYRTSVSLSNSSGKNMITEISFESNKD